jgi:hypothetical protein
MVCSGKPKIGAMLFFSSTSSSPNHQAAPAKMASAIMVMLRCTK